jgi:hypothetical protein
MTLIDTSEDYDYLAKQSVILDPDHDRALALVFGARRIINKTGQVVAFTQAMREPALRALDRYAAAAR